jgi:hypothetical protein
VEPESGPPQVAGTLFTVGGFTALVLLALFEQFQIVPGAAVAIVAARLILAWAES